ncbi:MAG: TonB-dependent receptor [Acidobacteria bacterium]|nr:TonB-dependent receptor [Acidobacteriota bacterium]
MKHVVTVLLALPLMAQIQHEEHLTVVYRQQDFRMTEGDGTVLVYDAAYFARFEPFSVGDMLKRVPGISGNADAGEFDHPQMRGLPPAYTQILINGQPIPGGNDRTVAVNWIPADAVQRIEVVRSSNATQSAEGIAGVINIVLRDQPGACHTEVTTNLNTTDSDGETHPQGSFSHHINTSNTDVAIHGSYQQRHNPKHQTSDIVTADDEQIFKDETNDHDADESHLNLNLAYRYANHASLKLRGFYHHTDRTDMENSSYFIDQEFDEGEFDEEQQDRTRLGLVAQWEASYDSGRWDLAVTASNTHLDRRASFGTFDASEREEEAFDIEDTKHKLSSFRASWESPSWGHQQFEAGILVHTQTRDSGLKNYEIDDEETVLVGDAGVYRLKEDRVDAWLVHHYRTPTWQLESGLRAERTDWSHRDRTQTQWYPSFHARIPLSLGSMRLSVARTTRRPDFQDLVPHPRFNEPRDDDTTIGNPQLEQEQAWGADIGLERNLKHGFLGIQFTYRDIHNLIELTQLDESLFQPQNRENARMWGIDFDASTALHALNAPNLSVFMSLSWQDSEVRDLYTGQNRQINLQSDYVMNLGFLQAFPRHHMSLGVNYLTQGNSSDLEALERASIQFGDDLEAVFEKQWGDKWTMRISAKNIFDASRTEKITSFVGLRDLSEVEQISFESERATRAYRLSLRAIF